MLNGIFFLISFGFLVYPGWFKEYTIFRRQQIATNSSIRSAYHSSARIFHQEDAEIIQLLTVDGKGNTIIPVLADPGKLMNLAQS